MKQFHEKCDGHENTLTIIRTDKEKIFGGFTRLSWESDYKQKEDDKGFLFNYNKNEIYYRNKDEQIEICTGYNHGPLFGKYKDLIIEDNCLHNKNSYELTGNFSYNTNGKIYALNNEQYFKVLNYEIYELFFK